MDSVAKSKNRLPLAIIGALVFFGILWRLDFPKPMVDDLFYTGAGLNLAQGGDLSNPMLARQEFPGHFFFVYPPLQSYAIAGWLKLFGINAHSMTAFALLMYFITAVSTITILRRHEAPIWLEWLVPLGVTAALLAVGLRPEPIAIALTMAGFAIFECARKGTVSLLFAFLLMFMGASAAPRMVLFSVALILLAANQLWRQPATQRPSPLRLWAPVVLAGIISGFVFLLQIHFRIGEFWQAFHAHAQRVGGRRINLLLGFLDDNPFLTSAQFPLVLLFIGLLLFAWQRSRSGLAQISLWLAITFPLVALSGGLGAGTSWYIVLALLLYSGAVLKTEPAWAQKLKVVTMVAFCFANVNLLATVWGMLGGKIKTGRGPKAEIALAMGSTSEHPVLIDDDVARYLFDYRIPAGMLDIQFAAPFPKSHIVGQMRPGDTYLIGPENVEVLKKMTLLDVGVAYWIPFGLPNRHFYRFPQEVFIVTAEECHGLRAKYHDN